MVKIQKRKRKRKQQHHHQNSMFQLVIKDALYAALTWVHLFFFFLIFILLKFTKAGEGEWESNIRHPR